ncbi:glycogen/starch/alpha-glucan phosphorylase [Fusibacter ferrireducens]|uniref:Alpha-1,4 glucan phosphorylase n=1 Tax=Fusibacter ferrireducens TaxID=2785058 RepID=A0ABS0A1F0_9FIRM|nr:glycogen/starch/alpha-glucan phosphorylase [Fusibacter ferrireducens]MBF4695955.1 glycogen/starch/alpha-glucan phosphorylase [Fusibacter ferrireducens]
MNTYLEDIKFILKSEYSKTLETATKQEIYQALSKTLMVSLTDQWEVSTKAYAKGKQAFYLSAEFLMGRALGNNLLNLGQTETFSTLLESVNLNLNEIEEIEEDAGLGNGGLGRLAACFLDSAASTRIPLHGYGIRYDYGIFKQLIENGFQKEEADEWLKYGDPWSIRRFDESVIVHFGDGDVRAVPYDTPIIGYEVKNINTLRLWKAEALVPFDFEKFNDQEYDLAVKSKNRAEDISRVLYPNDSEDQGKILRLKQQYFFVSASIQDMVKQFKQTHGDDFEHFSDYVAIQLNDTHPVVAIPELMRILIDEEHLTFKKAWQIANKTFSYTNHTILMEALEKWWEGFYKELLPRIYEIIVKIDKQFVAELKALNYDPNVIQKMRIISDHMIHMAYLAIYGSKAINGVAELHTEILKHQELKDWYALFPNKFQNKTNGITQRRWLALCNPELTAFITELLDNPDWLKDLESLKGLAKFENDDAVLNRLMDIKHTKKLQLVEYIKEVEGIELNPDAIFDIQIKRLHEYKRQLLNAFQILNLYFDIKENPENEIVPRTFIFGAKAAPGYQRAKGIIKFINEIAELVNNDADVNGRIKVVFVTNYRVSYGEKLFPAADLSEQISTAGKEASGTGNMKFMLNATPTIGTLDGANVEIVQEAGMENNFIFGAKSEEIEAMKADYDPVEIYMSHPRLKKIVDTLVDGTFNDEGTGWFKELHHSLLMGASWHQPDNYFILHDFDAYVEAQKAVNEAYKNKKEWAKKCLANLANAGKFSSDRTILEYAKDIWNIVQIDV